MHRHPLLAAACTVSLAGCAALVPALLTGGPAQAARITVSMRTIHLDVVAGPSTDRHHCDVVADLYRPSTATRAHPAPAILTTNGFGGSKDDQAGIGQSLGRRGYVVLSYSGLGFGGSGCKIYLDQPAYDGAAGSQLISFLGGTKRAVDGTTVDYVSHDAVAHDGSRRAGDPRVGMIGGSYGGEVQFAVASVDPRLDTIVPLITWNDLSYSLAPSNADLASGVSSRTPGTEKLDWTTLFFGVGIEDGVQGAQIDPSRDVGCPNFDDRACAAKAQMDALGYPDASTLALARGASVASYLPRIRIPTLLVQGQADTLFNLDEAVATYRALRAQGTPVSMIWQSWGHSHGTPAKGELDLAAPGSTYEGQRFLAWFDHYLKGSGTPTGPGFAYYRAWVPFDGTGPDTVQYGQAPAYPAGTTARLYASGSASLVPSRSRVQAGSATFANAPGGVPTSYSETSGTQGSYVPDESTPPSDAPGTYVALSSAPLAGDLDVAGVPTADLRLSAPTAAATRLAGPAGMVLVFVKVYDIAPDGSVDLVHRLIAPARVSDPTRPVHVMLPGIVHRFAAGHRISLVVAASDAAYRNSPVVTPVTVTTSAAAPSSLTLPVGSAAQAAAALGSS
ncbi:MAG: CocE/NonD family hydrolase [Frankiaceae bacterium]